MTSINKQWNPRGGTTNKNPHFSQHWTENKIDDLLRVSCTLIWILDAEIMLYLWKIQRKSVPHDTVEGFLYSSLFQLSKVAVTQDVRISLTCKSYVGHIFRTGGRLWVWTIIKVYSAVWISLLCGIDGRMSPHL